MKFRSALMLTAALSLAVLSPVAALANMVVKDATGATITVSSIAQGGVQHPLHVFEGQKPDGTVGPIQTATDGKIIVSDGPSGIAQAAVQATPGSDAVKAVAIQGVTSGKPIPVTVTGTPTVTVSGTVTTTGLTDTQLRATAVPVSISGTPAVTVAGVATSAKQPALGTAGSPSADVLSVQFVSGGTPFKSDTSVTYSGGAYDGTNNKNPAGFAQAIADAANSTNASPTRPQRLTSTDKSGTVTTGGAYQVAIASNATRNGCTILNPTTATEVLFVEDRGVGSPGAGNSWTVAAGGAYYCGGAGNVLTNGVKVSAATTGHVFIASEF